MMPGASGTGVPKVLAALRTETTCTAYRGQLAAAELANGTFGRRNAPATALSAVASPLR